MESVALDTPTPETSQLSRKRTTDEKIIRI